MVLRGPTYLSVERPAGYSEKEFIQARAFKSKSELYQTLILEQEAIEDKKEKLDKGMVMVPMVTSTHKWLCPDEVVELEHKYEQFHFLYKEGTQT